jgi:protein TonB
MFETVAPDAFVKRSRRVLYQTLPLSLTLHSAVIIAVGAVLLNHLDFPTQSPPVVRSYILAELPPPPPPPPEAPKAAPKPPPTAAKVVPPKVLEMAKLLAPTIIPDKIPDVVDNTPPPEGPIDMNAIAKITGVGDVAEGPGSPDGVVGGVGMPPPPAPKPPDGRLHVQRGKALPMKAIRQEYPVYPDEARTRGYEDNLTIRYVIGRDGRVKDITVLDKPYRQMFEDTVLKYVKQWRFSPYVNEEGQPEEVVHEVQFNFQVH